MKKNFMSKALPHIIAVVLFLIISLLYCSPIFDGKSLVAHDTKSWECMAQETREFNATHEEPTLWTNSMFGGMPTYQITTPHPNNIMQLVDKLLYAIPAPAVYLFLYLLCFYVMALCFRLNAWLSIVAAITFAFASYNVIILAAGHLTKAAVIAYMAPLIGSVFLAFRSNKWLGGLLTALFLTLAIRANHPQILYYTIIVLLFFGVVEFIYKIKEKQLKSFFATFGVLFIALIISVGINASNLLTTYEYSQYTMRGKSNGLTADTQNSQQGLNKDYITQWSYGIDETLTVLIPDFKGGASGAALSTDSETAEHLQKLGVPKSQITQIVKQMPLYWGTQPFTSGPVYFGAIVIFLFVLALFIVDKREKWWLLPMIILTLMLSWGKNFMWLTDFFIDYVPMYNKFRTVSMTLVATGFGVALLAMLALKKVFEEKDKAKLFKPILISAAITGGIALFFAIFTSAAGSFTAAGDSQFSGDYSFLRDTLPLDRAAMLAGDAWRSLLFIFLAAAVLYIYAKNWLKNEKIAYVALAVLFLADLVPVCKRYLNDDNFETKQKKRESIQPSAADKWLLDNDKTYYRVLDATVNIFNDATPAYFHKNIGGYHAAKLRRYQELINMQIEPEMKHLFAAFENVQTLDSLGVLNMLNMKYVIYNKKAQPLENPFANGNAWFVDEILVAENANEEMRLTGEIDTKREAVIDQYFANETVNMSALRDTLATIKLIDYQPNKLTYNVSTKSEQLAVFSEIFYDKGWNAYINGEKMPILRVNYLLRAMRLPAGDYEIVMKFEPKTYSIGNTLSLIFSIVLMLAVAAYFFFLWKQKNKNTVLAEVKNIKEMKLKKTVKNGKK